MKREKEATSIIDNLEQASSVIGELRQQLLSSRVVALKESEKVHLAWQNLWDMKEATLDTPGHEGGHRDSSKSSQSVSNSDDLVAMFEQLRNDAVFVNVTRCADSGDKTVPTGSPLKDRRPCKNYGVMLPSAFRAMQLTNKAYNDLVRVERELGATTMSFFDNEASVMAEPDLCNPVIKTDEVYQSVFPILANMFVLAAHMN